MSRSCFICKQTGNTFQIVQNGQITTIQNPLRKTYGVQICQDCKNNIPNLPQAIQEAANTLDAERKYQSGYNYAAGYHN